MSHEPCFCFRALLTDKKTANQLVHTSHIKTFHSTSLKTNQNRETFSDGKITYNKTCVKIGNTNKPCQTCPLLACPRPARLSQIQKAAQPCVKTSCPPQRNHQQSTALPKRTLTSPFQRAIQNVTNQSPSLKEQSRCRPPALSCRPLTTAQCGARPGPGCSSS